MAWIGGRKGRMGGNPGSVSKMSGDLPASIDSTTNRSANMDLTAVLMGRGAKAVGGHSGHARHMQAQTPQDVKVPDWIEAGAHICYLSRSTAQRIEVVVEMVNTSKAEVEISSVEGGVWKVIPFAVIGSAHNPLFPASALPPTEARPVAPLPGPTPRPAETVDLEDEAEAVSGAAASSKPSGKAAVVDLEEERARSRSPKR
mmetsp:Transcript_9861/g.17134  ORF Transcript_9861/g.17134 Transcript_9861/m.17134 type:complete len:201 (-) Transcript_9861:54-656(-)